MFWQRELVTDGSAVKENKFRMDALSMIGLESIEVLCVSLNWNLIGSVVIVLLDSTSRPHVIILIGREFDWRPIVEAAIENDYIPEGYCAIFSTGTGSVEFIKLIPGTAGSI